MSPGFQAGANTVRGDAGGVYTGTNAPTQSTTASVPAFLTRAPVYSVQPAAVNYASSLPFTATHTNMTLVSSALTIAAATNLAIAAGVYRNVQVSDDAAATFGAGTFDIRDPAIGMDVTFVVDDGEILQIDRRLDPNNRLKFGIGTGSIVRIVVGAFRCNPNTQRSGSFSHSGEIHIQLLLGDELAGH
jgi:hypothetical protein